MFVAGRWLEVLAADGGGVRWRALGGSAMTWLMTFLGR
jgi:hypothetical protein